MFNSPGLSCQPDCHRAGTPAARQSVMKLVPCTPQSPRRAVRPFTDKLGIMLYSISAHHGMFLETQRKIRSAFSSGLVSSPTIAEANLFTSGVNAICGSRSAVYSRYKSLFTSYGFTFAESILGQ